MLQKSLVPVTFPGGLDQKTPSRLLMPGRFLALENCVRRKTGQVRKRFGFSSLSNDISGTALTITNGVRVDTFKDDLLLFDAEELYSYSSASDKWVSRGDLTSLVITSDAVIRNGERQAMMDMCHNQGLTMTVYEDSRGGVRVTVIDDSTQAGLIYDQELSASGSRPKCVAIRNSLIAFYVEGSAIKSRVVRVENPSVLEAAQDTAGSSVASATFDIDSYGNWAIICYNNTSSGLSIAYVKDDGLIGGVSDGLPTAITVSSGTSLGTQALSVVGDYPNDRFFILHYDSTTNTNLRVRAYRSDLAVNSNGTVEAIANVRNVTGTIAADNVLHVYYELSSTNTWDHSVKTNTVEWDGNATLTIGTASVFKRSVGLGAKAFTVDDHQYVTVVHESNLQPTYFTVRGDGIIVSKMLASIAGGLSRDPAASLKTGIPRTITNELGQPITALQIRTKLQANADATVLATQRGVQKITYNFEAAQFNGRTLGENYNIAGGVMLAYDGVSATELGFHLYPENVTKAAASSGSLTAGIYNFRVVYEWVDGRGQIHRSAPSISQGQTVTDNQKITVTIPTLRLTAKDAPRANVQIVIYVAPKGTGTLYYRHGTVANNTGANSVTYDILTEPVTTNEILYTTGGIYENIAPPASTVVHVHKGRAWLGGLEDDMLAYSKEYRVGEGVAFSDFFRIPVDPAGGRVSTLGSLDEKLVIFKKDRTYALSGEGPLDTGAQDDYTRPTQIAGDIGCDNPYSLAITPVGLMFKSDKGIYLLSRSLQFNYIGAPVEDYNDLTITSATVIEDDDEVRFTTAEGVCLVYNYYFRQWSVFTNYEARSACNGLGTYLHLKEDGTVNREVADQYDDNGSKIQMAIETSWLSFAGIQAFQRVYNFIVMGDFISHHITRCKLAYDFENVYNETVYFNTQTGFQQSLFGEEDTFGEDPFLGGTLDASDVYYFRCKPSRQKCTSIKLRFEDIDNITEEAGGSFALESITFEVGRKAGANKLGPYKTIGSR